jgi:hypothetical protein
MMAKLFIGHREDCGARIADCGLKSSMLDTGYSMLDKDLLFSDPPPEEHLKPQF